MERRLTVSGHRSVLGEWEMYVTSPDVRLRGHVTRYAGYRESAHRGLAREEYPMPGVVLIIGFGPAITVGGERLASFTGGLTETPTIVESRGQHCMQIDLTPLGAFRLLGLPMDTLTGRAVPLEAVLGTVAAEITERLYALPSWPARFDLLDEVLLGRLAGGPYPSPEVVRAWELLAGSGGRMEIGRVAADTGWSRKHLISRFRAQVGLPPKSIASIMRFNRALGRLNSGDTLADIAVECGYYDQSHFNREFRRFTARSPRDYLAHRHSP